MIRLESLEVENFRSIKQQRGDFAPITVFYGPNGSGKSSFLYSLLLMKNVLLNLDRESSDYYDFGFVNLGDFGAIVHGHKIGNNIDLVVSLTDKGLGYSVHWHIRIGKDETQFDVRVVDEHQRIVFTSRQSVTSGFEVVGGTVGTVRFEDAVLEIKWDGVAARVQTSYDDPRFQRTAEKFSGLLNAPIDLVRSITIAPLQMAFSRGEHSVATSGASLNSTLYFSEDAVGTLLATRRYLQSPVSKYLEEITNRTLRVFSPPGDPNFSINVEDRSTGLETELVNDGYGVNRVAWLLALTLHDETKLMCIEEPETHLHPTSIRKLVRTFVEIMRNEEKRFLLTTHSEALVLALLAEVSRKKLKPEELAFYLTSKEGKETRFVRQEVNELGQIDDGLSSFMEGEMEDIAAFFEQTG